MFFQQCRRHLVICFGLLIMMIGLILMPVPGPGGTPVFLAGLAILATKFKWARDFLGKFKDAYGRMGKRKRRILTVSLLLFYLASGVIAWGWANRPEQKKLAEKIIA
jgi:uncharacterized protein (TIGR02611 family)